MQVPTISVNSAQETPPHTLNKNEAHPEDMCIPLTPEEEKEPKPKRKLVLRIESSVLAAAIVNSAPLHRRRVFLQPSHSFDQSSKDCSMKSDLKRRSWHVERVTARMLSVLEEAGSSLAALPAFNRSFSTESSSGVFSVTCVECTIVCDSVFPFF